LNIKQKESYFEYNGEKITDLSEVFKYSVISEEKVLHKCKIYQEKLIPVSSPLYSMLEEYESIEIKNINPDPGNLIILEKKPFQRFKYLGRFKFSDNKETYLLSEFYSKSFIRKSDLKGCIINSKKEDFKISFINKFLKKISNNIIIKKL